MSVVVAVATGLMYNFFFLMYTLFLCILDLKGSVRRKMRLMPYFCLRLIKETV